MNTFSGAGLVVALALMLPAATSCERAKAGDESQRAVISASAPGDFRLVASAATSAAVSSAARAEAKSIFGERCAACHGDNGDGDGPGAANLNPRPVNFHNQKWQQSISDDRIAKAIVHGGQAVGLSASMAPNPDLGSKPDVVAALVEHIRKFRK
jgi:mono/diheme cytochrome c family protein